MASTVRLGNIAGLEISARPSVLPALLLLWIGLSAAAYFFFHFTPLEALIGGLAAALLHYAADLVHQLGHALAARWTGHPMTGIRFWGPLSTSLYPSDEARLPAGVHIRRALGGPAASLLLFILAGLLYLVLHPLNVGLGWVMAFFALDSLLVFALGSFLPLGFTDGSTLLFWTRKN